MRSLLKHQISTEVKLFKEEIAERLETEKQKEMNCSLLNLKQEILTEQKRIEAEIRKEFRTEIANLRDELRQNGSSKESEYEIQQYKEY